MGKKTSAKKGHKDKGESNKDGDGNSFMEGTNVVKASSRNGDSDANVSNIDNEKIKSREELCDDCIELSAADKKAVVEGDVNSFDHEKKDRTKKRKLELHKDEKESQKAGKKHKKIKVGKQEDASKGTTGDRVDNIIVGNNEQKGSEYNFEFEAKQDRKKGHKKNKNKEDTDVMQTLESNEDSAGNKTGSRDVIDFDKREENKDKKKKKQKKETESGRDDKEVAETQKTVKSTDQSEENKDKKKKKKKKKKKQKKETESGRDDKEVAETKKTVKSTGQSEENKDKEKEKKKKKQKKKETESGRDDKEVAETKKTVKSTGQSEENKDKEKEKNKKKQKKKETESGRDDKEVAETKKTVKSTDQSENPMPKERSRRVSFADHVEVFPSSGDKIDTNKNMEDKLVHGKRFSKEEDEKLKEAVSNYIELHGLGEDGLSMILNCQSHPEVRNCWKEIGAALPWRPNLSVYHRAHVLFERDGNSKWSAEEYEMVRKYVEKHGTKWKTLAGALGKHRVHVKDTWRRIKLTNRKRGRWSQEEYQTLFDLVNMDLSMKATVEKKSQHGMLRDNICWGAISDMLTTRSFSTCCLKWYDQLASPMVAEGKWANADDYRLLDALSSLDACCMEDVDWDNLLEHRSGDICRKRWSQMVQHIGHHGSQSFPEQVEILARRYRPDMVEAREAFDNKPYVDQP